MILRAFGTRVFSVVIASAIHLVFVVIRLAISKILTLIIFAAVQFQDVLVASMCIYIYIHVCAINNSIDCSRLHFEISLIDVNWFDMSASSLNVLELLNLGDCRQWWICTYLCERQLPARARVRRATPARDLHIHTRMHTYTHTHAHTRTHMWHALV